MRKQAEVKAENESAAIIAESAEQAELIISETEKNVKREAKRKTKREVERLIAEARQSAEKEAAKIIANSRKEAEKVSRELTENTKKEAIETAKAAVQLKHEAEQKIKEAEDVFAQIAAQLKQRGEHTINRLQDQAKKEAVKSAEVILEAEQKEQHLTDKVKERAKDELEQVDVLASSPISKLEATEVGTGVSSKGDNAAELFQGKVRLTIPTSTEFEQIMSFQAHLNRCADLRLVSLGGSAAEGTIVVVAVDKPLPLLDIIGSMPPVTAAFKKGGDIQVSLRPRDNS
ncbi:hypothetical protein ACFLYR_04465 [Chloroflexota bacterium]